eukprot:790082-Rhodomonas_salina.1
MQFSPQLPMCSSCVACGHKRDPVRPISFQHFSRTGGRRYLTVAPENDCGDTFVDHVESLLAHQGKLEASYLGTLAQSNMQWKAEAKAVGGIRKLFMQHTDRFRCVLEETTLWVYSKHRLAGMAANTTEASLQPPGTRTETFADIVLVRMALSGASKISGPDLGKLALSNSRWKHEVKGGMRNYFMKHTDRFRCELVASTLWVHLREHPVTHATSSPKIERQEDDPISAVTPGFASQSHGRFLLVEHAEEMHAIFA